MNIIKLAAPAAIILALFSGCTLTSKVASIPIMDVTTKLRRADYVVLGTATGQACAEENCFLGSCTKKAGAPGDELLSVDGGSTGRRASNPLIDFLLGTPPEAGPSRSQIAEQIAMFKAIESVPNADAILSPRFESETTEEGFPGITHNVKSCVTVKGKAIHVNSDAEMAAAK
jgi:hypothetical protein